ncbi:MAG: DUF4352 domain-containing protein [Dehalococcoidia bacterium]
MAKSELERKLAELKALRAKNVVSDEEYAARREALLTDTATAVAAKSGSRAGGIFKWGMMGCLGMFAAVGLLFIVVIVLLAAAVGSSADNEEDSGGDVHVALANGASEVISPENQGSRKVRVTIVRWTDGATSTNQFLQPEQGKKYIAFEVLVENVGDRETGVLDWKLRDTKDGEHERRFVSGLGDELDAVFNLTPGGRVEGLVVFEVDADASVKWLRADPSVFAAHDLYFDGE